MPASFRIGAATVPYMKGIEDSTIMEKQCLSTLCSRTLSSTLLPHRYSSSSSQSPSLSPSRRRLTFCVTHPIMHYEQGNHLPLFIFSGLGGDVTHSPLIRNNGFTSHFFGRPCSLSRVCSPQTPYKSNSLGHSPLT